MLPFLSFVMFSGCGVSQDRLLNTIEPDTWQQICSHKRVAFDTAPISYTCDDTLIERPAITAEAREQDCLETYSSSTTWTQCTATYGDFRDLLQARLGVIDVEEDASPPIDSGIDDPRRRPGRPNREPLFPGPSTTLADPCRPQPLPTEVTACVAQASR